MTSYGQPFESETDKIAEILSIMRILSDFEYPMTTDEDFKKVFDRLYAKDTVVSAHMEKKTMINELFDNVVKPNRKYMSGNTIIKRAIEICNVSPENINKNKIIARNDYDFTN